MSSDVVAGLQVGGPTLHDTGAIMSSKAHGQKPETDTLSQEGVRTSLPEAMTGRASPAKAAVGDKPVFDYIAGLPQPQRGVAEAIDALAARTLPGLRRSVKWGMAYYGVGDGW